MKAAAHNGLVRAVVKKAFKAYREGDTIRLSPAEAQLYTGAGYVEEAKLPKGTETVTVSDPKPIMPEKILPNPEPAIPDDWQDLHILQLSKVAKQITKQDRPFTEDEARAVIRAELERRLTE